MTIQASAKYANVLARVYTYLQALDLPGAPLILFDGDNARTDKAGAWVRLTLIPTTERWSGHQDDNAYRIKDTRLLLVADVFVADAAAQGEAFDAYLPVRIADGLRDAFTAMSLDFIDYTDPENQTAVTDARIRAIDPPASARLPKDGPWLRQQVETELRWNAKHAA